VALSSGCCAGIGVAARCDNLWLMPVVALVTTDPEVVNGEDVDIDILRDALESDGLLVETPVWHDPSVDWSAFDLAIMRSPWDYPSRLAEFLSWLDRATAVTQVLNTPGIIRWNLDKRYLHDLAARGVTIVDATFCQSVEEASDAIHSLDSRQVVIKPTVSVGSKDSGRFAVDDPAALELATRIIVGGKTAMVQPAIASVERSGETELVYFDGRYSHAVTKGPILDLGGGYVGGEYTERITATQATSAEVKLADATMLAIADVASVLTTGNPRPLYARLDIVGTDAGPALLEAELFEPSYFLNTAAGSELAFVSAVRGRLAAKVGA
jgi:hypothetical protein